MSQPAAIGLGTGELPAGYVFHCADFSRTISVHNGAEETVLMDSKEHWRGRVMVDSLRGLSERQLTIVYMRIELRMGVSQIAKDLHLPLELVETEDFLARQHVTSYMRARVVSLADVPDEDEELPGAGVQSASAAGDPSSSMRRACIMLSFRSHANRAVPVESSRSSSKDRLRQSRRLFRRRCWDSYPRSGCRLPR